MTGNIYITGDKHGDMKCFKPFSDRFETCIDDVMIILGDVGINYYLNHLDILAKDMLKYVPMTFFCVHGNHEERPYNVGGYKLVDFMGAKAYVEDMFPNIYFAKDGEIYNFGGSKVICIGGAYSVDKNIRLANGWQWFESEQPDDEIKAYVEKQLDSIDWKVDYVLSHTCPSIYIPTDMFINGIGQSGVDRSTESWLGNIEYKLSYKKWYCGHWHTDRLIDNIRFMFNDIVELK